MNELKEKARNPDEAETAGDYYVVETRSGFYWVTAETARRIGAQLDRRWPPRWIKFVDNTGARTWLRTSIVECVHESTEAQRSRERTFRRACHREAKADKRWGEDED